MLLNHIYNLLTFTILAYCCSNDYYEILDVPRTAEQNEITFAYLRMALQLYPYKNPYDPEASEKFFKLQDAYVVLSDERMRKDYDRCGEQCVKKNNMGYVHWYDSYGSFIGDFGFQFNESPEQKEIQKQKLENARCQHIHVTLEKLYNGIFLKLISIGTSIKPTHVSRQCNCRQEMIIKQSGSGQFQIMHQNVCDECPNMKRVTEDILDRTYKLEIEPGMRDGQEIKFTEVGEPHIDGELGEPCFKIETRHHLVFERRGDDLYTNLRISLQDALIGFQAEITQLDGRKILVERDTVTLPGTKIHKKGEGMPNYDNNNLHGYLIVNIDIEFPMNDFSEQDKEDLKRILNQRSINKS